jgi:excisionase family DNA binding protein
MEKLDEYLRIKQAAEYLGVCPNTLRNWGRDGRFTEYRHPVNNYRLYKTSELTRLLRQAERSGGQSTLSTDRHGDTSAL